MQALADIEDEILANAAADDAALCEHGESRRRMPHQLIAINANRGTNADNKNRRRQCSR